MAAAFIAYSAARDEINPENDNCPSQCPALNQMRTDLCNVCPVKIEKEAFEISTIESLDESAPGWKRYGFQNLYGAVLDALDMESLPAARRTVVTARMIRIIEGERARFRRVKDWNDRAKRQNEG
jgi:hypothetical protein